MARFKIAPCITTLAFMMVARGLAFLRTDDWVKARKALKRLRKITDAADPEETFGPGTGDGPIDLLQIAHGVLAGEMAAAAGDLPDVIDFDGPTLANFAWSGSIVHMDDCITESWFRRIETTPHCLPPWMRTRSLRPCCSCRPSKRT